ncbi:MAG: hypothetical protein J7K36_00585 [Archaeoglobaceae archaeon]|nr:hypothetical protein [Archaeoglobaceae archaeon]
MLGERIDNNSGTTEEFIWLKVTYHFHVFHYRMPETSAIAAVTPFVPSPLTVKMAIIASLFQLGDINGAEIIAKNMHKIEVKIVPPKAALSFKAFLRYRSPPAVELEEKELDETGSYYPSRPHMREYAIFEDSLEIYVKLPVDIADYGKRALKNIRYLGSKDSVVTCFDLREDNPPHDSQSVSKLDYGNPGIVVLLADFKQNTQIQDLKQLIPGNRDEKMYEKLPYIIPGNVITKGRTRVFITRW